MSATGIISVEKVDLKCYFCNVTMYSLEKI